ncbi:flagellar basal body P-ring formation chaperone FlgA [Rhodopseudomonas palustris]|uniref:Flagella basal body P-ring formation protein FlgA n=1 Tax=Rhodopseudomonas palustris (strain BisB18) TaxID=316056 RepID=Q21AC4_RHOPB
MALMRAISTLVRRVWSAAFVATVISASALAEEPARFPVPATVIYPGDLIKDEMIIDRSFAPNLPGVAAFVGDRPAVVGRIARRTLLPGQLIPINALEEQKLVSRGSVVKVVVEDGSLSIVTYGSSLQAGSPGSMIQLRNLDTGVTIRGIVQPDGSVRIQNG